MSKWIKIFLIGLAMLLFTMNISAKQEPVTIQMWDWFIVQSKFIDSELKLFEEKHPYIKVKRTKQIQQRYRDLVNFAFRSSTLPDLLAIPVDTRVDMMQAGYFYPLNKWMNRAIIKRFPKGAFMPGINIYNGNYYSFPVNSAEYWCQFYINNEVFRQAGLVDKKGKVLYPKTWGEVYKYAKIITDKGTEAAKKGGQQFWGFGMFSKPEHLFPNFMYEWARVAGARGGNQELHLGVDYKTGRYNFTEGDAFLKMFKFVLTLEDEQLMYPNGLSIDDETMRAAFADGRIGMIMGGSWVMNGWETSHPDFKDYDVLMIPPYDEKGYSALCPVNIAGAWYGMGANTKQPAAAWELLEWFATPEFGARYVRAGLGLSIFPSANVAANAKTRQFGQYMEISAKYAMPGPSPHARNPQLANVRMDPVMPNHLGVFWGIVSHQIPEGRIPNELKNLEDRLNKELERAFDEAIKKGYKVSLDDLKFPDWNPLKPYEQK
ncbi:MAG: ABC transporter substrate-binding protein [Bacillota bacterium]